MTTISVLSKSPLPTKDREVRKDVECIRVMQLTDSLAMGGTERVAVNLANALPRDQFQSYLCTTRCGGPLADSIAADVKRIDLQRTHRFDVRAIRRLIEFNRQHRIQIMHAHSSSLMIANIASRFAPYPAIIWHDHFGRYQVENRSVWLYRAMTQRVAGVIAVNRPLADWSKQQLRIKSDRVWYLPNFPVETDTGDFDADVPGIRGQRVICVANLRPEKDHLTLVTAMRKVVDQCPDAHLLLLGSVTNEAQVCLVQQRVAQLCLEKQVHFLGSRREVGAWLQASDVGVLSSVSEGLPLSLLEYGLAGLACVATDVGQCREVLADGECGTVVASRSADQLAQSLIAYLKDNSRRKAHGNALQIRIKTHYSAQAAIERLGQIYRQVLNSVTPSQDTCFQPKRKS